jgi:hypothetical protein
VGDRVTQNQSAAKSRPAANIASDELMELITEVETAASAAAATAQQERNKAVDLAAVPDAKADRKPSSARN